MLGRAAVAMWWDIAPEVRAEWEEWHTHEHMPERLSIPGFLRGTRWIALSGEPSYFILYETARLSTVTRGPYLERLNNPTPWSLQMMPHHLNMVRSLCRVLASFGGGVPAALATIRFKPRRGRGTAMLEQLAGHCVNLPQAPGLACAHLLRAERMPAAQTTEQKIRGGDASADCILLIGGYDADTVNKAADGLTLDESDLVESAVRGVYRPAFSLSAKEGRQ